MASNHEKKVQVWSKSEIFGIFGIFFLLLGLFGLLVASNHELPASDHEKRPVLV